jgi:hypothetical protein
MHGRGRSRRCVSRREHESSGGGSVGHAKGPIHELGEEAHDEQNYKVLHLRLENYKVLHLRLEYLYNNSKQRQQLAARVRD